MIQDALGLGLVIVYKPVFTHGGWFAWVARENDAHKPAWARRLTWWPLTEEQALSFFNRR